jgi:hypothetical protein
LYVQNVGEDVSTKVALSLTQARERLVVRFTGGCGLMSDEDARAMQHLLTEPFRDFGGAILFGGTQMVSRDNPSQVIPGITEIPPLIRDMCPDARVLGVVARTSDFQILPGLGLIVSNEPSRSYATIAHPNQDVCLVLQKSVDQTTVWDTEYQVCEHIVRHLVDYAQWRPLLFVYNGGGITEKEILLWAKNEWPILLVRGSGRKADQYANDENFLLANPCVTVAETTTWSIRDRLEELGAIPISSRKAELRLIPKVG